MSHHIFNTEIYDLELSKIPIYKQYPMLLPFIGKKYHENANILLLGESHYFPENSTIHRNPSTWYKQSSSDLKGEEPVWLNTRRVLNNIESKKPQTPQKWKKSRTIYRNIEQALINAGFPMSENLLCNVAFMNAFLRPAEHTGKSINVSTIDIEQSVITINKVIEIIQPKHICFVSVKAYKNIASGLKMQNIDVVPHPCSNWWHRKSKNGIGREKFIELLKGYKA